VGRRTASSIDHRRAGARVCRLWPHQDHEVASAYAQASDQQEKGVPIDVEVRTAQQQARTQLDQQAMDQGAGAESDSAADTSRVRYQIHPYPRQQAQRHDADSA